MAVSSTSGMPTAPTTPPPLPADLRVAIVTLWDGGPAFACSIMHWCDHAQRLADVFASHLRARTDLLLIRSPDASQFECTRAQERALRCSDPRSTVESDCPQMRVLEPDAALVAAVQRFGQIGCRDQFKGGLQNMYKWLVFGLVQYQLIVYADLDVELLRPEQPADVVGRRWRDSLHVAAPPDRQPRMLSVNDMESPVNGGLWTLAWPSRQLYERGLRLMHSASWNETDGFDHAGAPRALVQSRPTLRSRLRHTVMLRSNSWRFAMGDCDQAFLLHLLYVTTSVGGDHEPVGAIEDKVGLGRGLMHPPWVHTARHYYGYPKPWYWTHCQLDAHRAAKPRRFATCQPLSKRRSNYLRSNVNKVLYFINHTRWEARLGRSGCAMRFKLVFEEFTRFGKAVPTAPPKYSGSMQRLR